MVVDKKRVISIALDESCINYNILIVNRQSVKLDTQVQVQNTSTIVGLAYLDF